MATAAILLDGEAFNQMVLEDGLKTWEQNGYIYCGKRGPRGWLLYRTYGPKFAYLWEYTQVCTQDNVAGGTLLCDITFPTGQVAQLNSASVLASGNRAVYIARFDSASKGAYEYLSSISAVASAKATAPAGGHVGNTTNGPVNGINIRFSPGSMLELDVTSAAQTETATIHVSLLLSTNTQPTVSWAGSGGTPNAAAAALNTITAVLLP